MSIKDDYDRIFGNKQRILAIFSHPDDLELYCGATVARLISDGKVVRSVKMTSGDRGSRGEKISQADLGNLREQEDADAMESLGIKKEDNIYLRLMDGTVDNSLTTIGLLAQQIRLFKPEIIITHNPENVVIRFEKDMNWINHRDHRNTGVSAIDAAYPYSRDLLFFPEHFTDPAATSQTVNEFLLVDYYDHPDMVNIEVTSYIPSRLRAHACHKSQYSEKDAQESADFFTKIKGYPEAKNFERFRHVVGD